tara:strand:+ start:144 stop:260 length:117 start_codon:yes stop_codon:yes gene_type:complete
MLVKAGTPMVLLSKRLLNSVTSENQQTSFKDTPSIAKE